MRADGITGHERLRHIPQRRAGGDGDEIGLGLQLGEHVAGIIIEPFGMRFGGVRGKADRPADLKDHLGHRFAETREQIAIMVEIGTALTGVGVADMDVQHRRAGVVAIDGGLHLLVPRQRDIAVARQPFGAIGRRRDDHRVHLVGKQRIIGIIHGIILLLICPLTGWCAVTAPQKIPPVYRI